MWKWVIFLHYYQEPSKVKQSKEYDTEQEAEHALYNLVKDNATGFVYGTIERRAYVNQ